MITSPIVITRPTTPGVAPGTALPAGPTGASAYALAVAAGFVGSQSDWLVSLEGAPGLNGAPGAPGAPGLPTTVNGKSGSSITLTADDVSAAHASDLTAHVGNISNPHGVTAAQTGAYTKAQSDASALIRSLIFG